jgi:DNA polymerase zeta
MTRVLADCHCLHALSLSLPGKKVCLHLHGVFPYLLVKAPTDEIRYGEQLAHSLDMAINLTFEKGDKETKHVYNIQLVELL